jgi:hypothetical protein
MNWSNMNAQATKPDAALDNEQVNQVIDAILAGKYSWACVLMLRFIGHNPLHYSPYRTYNRLLKEQLRLDSSKEPNRSLNDVESARKTQTKISDLKFTEAIEDQTPTVHGGLMPSSWLNKLRSLSYGKLASRRAF